VIGSACAAVAVDVGGLNGSACSKVGMALFLFCSTLRSVTVWLNGKAALAAPGGVAGGR
jgi:hypothetical protein